MDEYAQLTTSPKREARVERRDIQCLTKDEVEVITMWLAQSEFC